MNKQFLTRVIASLSLAASSIAVTHAYSLLQSGNGGVEVTADVLFPSYHKSYQDFNLRDFEKKSSDVGLKLFTRQHQAQIGIEIYNTFNSKLKFNIQRSFFYMSSPRLGKTEIGKTTGAFEDALVNVVSNGSTIAYYPFIRDTLHSFIWKYHSGNKRYYNYGFSFLNNETTSYGKYNHKSGYIFYNFDLNNTTKVTVHSIFAKQVATINGQGDYISYPLYLGLNYFNSNYNFNVLFGSYFHKEKHKISIDDKNYRLYQYGFKTGIKNKIPNLPVLVHFDTAIHYSKNKNPIALSNFIGQNLEPHSVNLLYETNTGVRYIHNEYLELFADYSHRIYKWGSTNKNYSGNYFNVGLEIKIN